MKVTVGRRIEISASHKLRDYEYCANTHGHNYQIELFAEFDSEAADTPDDESNMLLDFDTMKRDLTTVLGHLDQHDINEAYGEPNPTAEYVAARWLLELNKLNKHYTRIRVSETSNSFVEASL